MIRHRPDGTGFRLFPQYAEGYAEPELVLVSRRAGTIGPGPSDATMYVANAVDKESQYDPPAYMPPYRGTMFAPALPDRCGNFDYIPVDAEQFLAAHLYGTMRHTLDVWELYLRRQVVWWHASFLPQLELIPVVRWRNAHCGPGFLEAGIIANRYGRGQLFCLNFDVIAHETGHAILFSQVGAPPADRIHGPYLAFHESFADLVSLIAALHFPSVVQRLLQQTDGNLYVLNLVNRLGEYSDKEQVRLASNTVTMADVGGLRLGPDGGWIDPLGLDRNAHALAEPLTGAIFDIFVEIYQDGLVARGLIPPDADARGWTREEVAASLRMVRHESARSFARFTQGFHASLAAARDLVGRCMAHVMLTIPPESLSFDAVAAKFLEAAARLGQGPNLPALLGHFLWRGIDPRPLLTGEVPAPAPRRFDKRPIALRFREPLGAKPVNACSCSPRAFLIARRLMPHDHRSTPETAPVG